MSADEPILIAVMGGSGAGKSSFINKAADAHLAVGHGLIPCTQEIQCADVRISGHNVRLIDTPALDDDARTDASVLESLAAWLYLIYQHGMLLTAIIFLQPDIPKRIMSFQIRRLRMLKDMCGSAALQNIVIVSSPRGSGNSTYSGTQRWHEVISNDQLWGEAISKGARVTEYTDSKHSALSVVSIAMSREKRPLQIQVELAQNGGVLVDTSAGCRLLQDLIDFSAKHGDEIERYEEDLRELKSGATSLKDRQLCLDWQEQIDNLKKRQMNLERDKDHFQSRTLLRQGLEHRDIRLHAFRVLFQTDPGLHSPARAHNVASRSEGIPVDRYAYSMGAGTSSNRHLLYSSMTDSEVSTRSAMFSSIGQAQGASSFTSCDNCQESQRMNTSETRSIRTDNRSYDLATEQKQALISEFVDEVSDAVIRSGDEPFHLGTLDTTQIEVVLKEFAILLHHTANNLKMIDKANQQAATFIRHTRSHDIAPKLLASLQSRQTLADVLFREGNNESLWEPDRLQIVGTNLLDDDDFLARERPPTPPQLPRLRDVEKARDFILDSSELTWLSTRIRQICAHPEPDGSYKGVRRCITQVIDGLNRFEPLTAVLDWDPRHFLSKESPHQTVSLSEILTYCGTLESAYAATALGYLRMTWPDVGQQTLACLEEAYSKGSSDAQIREARLAVWMDDSITRVELTGKAEHMLQILESCIWLATSCRATSNGEDMSYCIPRVDVTNNGLSGKFNESDSSTADLWSMRPHLRMSVLHTAIEKTENLQESEGLCWLKMIRNPVLVKGYPIPPRDEPEKQKGLEATLDVLIALSHAHLWTTFAGTSLFKGLVSALIPVLAIGSSMVWHFLINEDGSRMSYCQANIARLGHLDLADLQTNTRRHFVGLWTGCGRIRAGVADESLYQLKLSKSDPAEKFQCELNNVSVSGGKYITVGASFRITRKDTASVLAYADQRQFELQIEEAGDMGILFYGTEDRRGWILDGASTLLHLARAWMSSKNARFMSPQALDQFEHMSGAGGKEAALDLLKRNKSRSIKIFSNDEEKIESTLLSDSRAEMMSDTSAGDSGYQTYEGTPSVASKQERKETVTYWTFENLVLEIWRVLEAMRDTLEESRQTAPSIALEPSRIFTNSPLLVGWEAQDIVYLKRYLRPRAAKLSSNGKEWLRFAKASSAIPLLARTFGDLIIPGSKGLCWRESRMPIGMDFLAVPLYIWAPAAERWLYDADCCGDGSVQVHDGIHWHVYETDLRRCCCNGLDSCDVVTRLSDKAPRNTAKGKRKGRAMNVFEAYPMGIALIGDPKKLQGVQKLDWPVAAGGTASLHLDANNDSASDVHHVTKHRRTELGVFEPGALQSGPPEPSLTRAFNATSLEHSEPEADFRTCRPSSDPVVDNPETPLLQLENQRSDVSFRGNLAAAAMAAQATLQLPTDTGRSMLRRKERSLGLKDRYMQDTR